MKMKFILTAFLTCFIALSTSSFKNNATEIEWMSWEEAIKKSETDKNPKKIFIDVYTDWCGWCKKMDKDTFNHSEVASYMNDNFYMVKLDGEGKEDIEYKGNTFKYVSSGKRGYHELAASLLQGRLSYPTVVFLDENQKMLSPVPGYKKPKEFLMIAKFFGDNIYLDKTWDEYQKEFK
ncbi:Thioredoxin-related protein [Zhouia amylolytica]|uniref:Thioredoxin-related protein n=2 Tax=Zhouia amylolytica TaxID=376730 RepID=A0A1I6V0K5_9FLAO|nr:Thioredoxin-related protein [Zhouia amylolytica]